MFNKKLLNSVEGSAAYVFKAVLFQWFNLVFSICVILIFSRFISNLRYATRPNYVLVAVSIAALVLLKCEASKLSARFSLRCSQNAKSVLRNRLFERLIKLGASYDKNVSTAEVVQVGSEGIEQLEIYFGQYMPQLIYAALAPITLFAVVGRFDLKTALTLLVCVPLIPLSIVAVQKLAKRLLSKYWSAYTGLGDTFLENIQGLTTLKIYGADEFKHRQMNESSEFFRKATMRVLIAQLNSIAVMDFVAYGGAVAGILAALYGAQKGDLTFFETIAVVLLSSEFFIPMRRLGSFFHIAMNGAAAADKIFNILNAEPQNVAEGGITGGYGVSFKNAGFSYGEGDVLKGLNATFGENGMVAIAGKSGCGKSTIASLLSGKNAGYFGSIKIGDTELKNISQKALSKAVTLVSDNSYIFKGSVEQSLKMAKPNATKEEMENALKSVNLYDFLAAENGLQTKLTEQGANFSGGQRQRLAIAAALLRDSPIYVFDESTSGVDVESEEIIMKTIRSLSKRKSVILISHRLANLKYADNILFMENGVIAEEGSHKRLVAQNGGYARVFNEQKRLEGYLGDAAQKILLEEAF